MNIDRVGLSSSGMRAAVAALMVSSSTAAFAQSVPIVKPGAPGERNTVLTVEQASQLAGATYTPADVDFM